MTTRTSHARATRSHAKKGSAAVSDRTTPLDSPAPGAPPTPPPLDAEWLETDGLGGFASGTVSGIRTRRYHALLLAATTPPTGRFVLVNGMEVRVRTPAGSFDLSSQRYAPDVVHPSGAGRIEGFTNDPWPRWNYRLEDGTRIVQELFARHGSPSVIVLWRLLGSTPNVTLSVRPLLSSRDTHALHQENGAFRFDAAVRDGKTVWHPYDGAPALVVETNGAYMHHPLWYRQFLYTEEQARGLDCTEDLASPGSFHFNLSRDEAALILAADTRRVSERDGTCVPSGLPSFLANRRDGVLEAARAAREEERAYREAFSSQLERAADAYLVRRGEGMTIVAGYPWFSDWGRDTFAAIRGLCIATGRVDDARRILLEWARAVSEGMIPNHFPEQGGAEPEFNSVDASLWYVIAVREFLNAAAKAHVRVLVAERKALEKAMLSILRGYADGTRHGIHAAADGLLACGRDGVPLTWMDSTAGDTGLTPRTGKPVEIQALWLNALRIGSDIDPESGVLYDRALAAFESRFWNEDTGALHDVVDVDHVEGTFDPTFRPNQIFAVGGLPLSLVEGDRARRLVDAVEARLLTPFGLRTLAPEEPGYAPRFEGDAAADREGSHHQGTVWPRLLGPFVEAWVRVRGGTSEAKREARERFLAPLLQHLDTAGLGHIGQMHDAEPPFTPRGCPFQAWSVAEAIRLDRVVLAE